MASRPSWLPPPAPDLRVGALLEEVLVDARADHVRTLAIATLMLLDHDPTPRPRLQ